MVLPIEYSKGLEFDVVLLFNANEQNYPAEDGFTKLLYVAATRALHELVVMYAGKLTDLIAAPVSEEQKQKSFVVNPQASISKMPEEEPKTKTEIALELAREGHREMELRDRIGPKRIEVNKPQEEKKEPAKAVVKRKIGTKVDYYASALGRSTVSEKTTKKPVSRKAGAPFAFGSMPETTRLSPLGHKKIDVSVRWCTKNSDSLDITSTYGLLRVMPISKDTVRITFAKGQFGKLAAIPEEIQPSTSFKWNCRETREQVEVLTDKLSVRIDKKTGAISFFSAKGQLLLAENTKLPRQIECGTKNQCWTYFDWKPKEILRARGLNESQWLELNATAKYISHEKQDAKAACIMSNNGYQILVPAGELAMSCTIPVYGPYLYTEGSRQIDYFFRTAR